MNNQFLPSSITTTDESFQGEYEVQKCIGQGSFATVYLAQQKKTSLPVAVKVILSSRISKKLLSNIETEIHLLRGMKHPNITELYDIQRLPGKVCLVMEYCALGDLSDYIKDKRLPLGIDSSAGGLKEIQYRHLLRQLASAFKFLRDNNVIHRDLKPQNILLSEPKETLKVSSSMYVSCNTNDLPQLKVADFGLAKILPTQALTETTCGSPLYMAPEVHYHHPYDSKVDLWSIGAVVYEMILGQPPFPAKSIPELLYKIKVSKDRLWFPDETGDPNHFDGIDAEYGTSSTFEQSLVKNDAKDLLRGLLKQVPSTRMSFDDFFLHPAVCSTDFYLEAIETISNDLSCKNINTQTVLSTLRSKKSTISQESIKDLKLSFQTARSFNSQVISVSQEVKECIDMDMDIERDYIMIDSAFDNLNIKENRKKHYQSHPSHQKKEAPLYRRCVSELPHREKPNNINPRINKVSISRTPYRDKAEKLNPGTDAIPFTIMPHRDKTNVADQVDHAIPSLSKSVEEKPSKKWAGLDMLRTPKSLPSSLLQNSKDDEHIDNDTMPQFLKERRSSYSENVTRQIGWGVGARAAAIASVFSKASSKLFGAQDLPTSQTEHDSNLDHPDYSLIEASNATQEEELLIDTEKVACQAYALARFADIKFKKLKRNSTLISSSEPKDKRLTLTRSLNKTFQESFLLYIKALSLLYIGIDKVSCYWSDSTLSNKNMIVSARLNRASRWLQAKTNECIEKAELLQNRMVDYGIKIESYDTDELLYNFAINSCQDGISKEIKETQVVETEADYLIGLWMLQAILFRSPQDPQLSGEDTTNIRIMMTMIENHILTFRKTLEEFNLHQYSMNSYYLPSQPRT